MAGVFQVLNVLLVALIYFFLWRVTRVIKAQIAPRPPAKRTVADSNTGSKDARFFLRFSQPMSRAGEEIAVAQEMTIGRGAGCNIVLSGDSFASSVHARVYTEKLRAYIEDLGSTNGTFVNGKQITSPRRLKKGDNISIGQAGFEVIR